MVTIIFITYITLSQSQQNKFHIFSIFLHLVMHFTRISTFIRINETQKKKKASCPKWPSSAQWREQARPSGVTSQMLKVIKNLIMSIMKHNHQVLFH